MIKYTARDSTGHAVHCTFTVNVTSEFLTTSLLKEGNALFNDALNTFLVTGRERERNVLFNDALNAFYLRLYGVRHMVKDHSDSEKGNPLAAT